jgi:hypothetical protein
MPKKEIYEYAIIRYVPRVEREEFLNIGVIVFCKRRDFLEVKYLLEEEKIRSFYEEVDIEVLEVNLKTWDLISKGKKEGGEIARLDIAYRFRWLTSARSTIIQSSKVHPGMSEDPDKIVQDLFMKYVL